MRNAYKYRIYPTRSQTMLLNQELAAAQSLYNAALEQRRTAWKRRRLSLSYFDQAKELKELRASDIQTPTNFSACQDVLKRLDKAFQAFFRRLKKGDKPGFPRLRSKDRYDSLTFPSYGDGCRIKDNHKLYTCKAWANSASSGTARSTARSRPSPSGAMPAAGTFASA